jgi:hypothetical protein
MLGMGAPVLSALFSRAWPSWLVGLIQRGGDGRGVRRAGLKSRLATPATYSSKHTSMKANFNKITRQI